MNWYILFPIFWMAVSAIVLLAEMGWWTLWPNDFAFGRKRYWRLSVFGILFLLWFAVFISEMGLI